MSIKRDLHLGNTEESFWFCPEEILYMQAVTNEKETKVVLLNNEWEAWLITLRMLLNQQTK